MLATLIGNLKRAMKFPLDAVIQEYDNAILFHTYQEKYALQCKGIVDPYL